MSEIKFMRGFLTEKLNELKEAELKAENSLKKAPEGSMVVSHSNGYEQFYYKKDTVSRRREYIPAKNKKLVEALVQKEYDQKLLKAIADDKNKIHKLLISSLEMKSAEVYAGLSETRRKFVQPHILTDEQYIEKWLNVPYRGKEFWDDVPLILTEKGERVRSKTEKILADKFYSMGIPYRYEYPVRLKGFGTVYPDFTLLNVSERKELYLEHFGMMDNEKYCQNAIAKVEEYEKCGIYPGKNLLLTFETSQQPLNMKTLEMMLREFVL